MIIPDLNPHFDLPYHFLALFLIYPFPISEHEAAQRTLQGSNQELERKYVRVESECQILRKIVSELDSGCRRLQRQAIEAVNAAEQQNVELAQEIVSLRSTIDASGLYDMHVLLSESNAKHEKEKGMFCFSCYLFGGPRCPYSRKHLGNENRSPTAPRGPRSGRVQQSQDRDEDVHSGSRDGRVPRNASSGSG